MRQFAVDEALRPLDGVTTHEPGEPSTAMGPSPAAGGTEPAPPSRSIDGYEIFEELGRGAMGVVFKALDPRLKRVVAIKTVSEAMFTAPAQLRRFIAEAEVIARLETSEHHPDLRRRRAERPPVFLARAGRGGKSVAAARQGAAHRPRGRPARGGAIARGEHRSHRRHHPP